MTATTRTVESEMTAHAASSGFIDPGDRRVGLPAEGPYGLGDEECAQERLGAAAVRGGQ